MIANSKDFNMCAGMLAHGWVKKKLVTKSAVDHLVFHSEKYNDKAKLYKQIHLVACYRELKEYCFHFLEHVRDDTDNPLTAFPVV